MGIIRRRRSDPHSYALGRAFAIYMNGVKAAGLAEPVTLAEAARGHNAGMAALAGRDDDVLDVLRQTSSLVGRGRPNELTGFDDWSLCAHYVAGVGLVKRGQAEAGVAAVVIRLSDEIGRG